MGLLSRLLFAFFLYFSNIGLAEWLPTWGGELTFTSAVHKQRMKTAPLTHGPTGVVPWSQQNQDALEAFYNHMKQLARSRPDISQVKLKEAEDKWGNDVVRVTYHDGWHFDVTMDPWCLEVIVPPFTLIELRKNKTRIQRDIFDQMAQVQLFPERRIGAGHLHMGMESGFKNDVRLFRNWLVDHANHRELAAGALERDHENALPLYLLSANQRARFKALITKVDAGEITSVRQLATRFAADVLFEGLPATGKRIMKYKYLQINILRMAKLDTWDTLEPNLRWADYEAWILYDEVKKEARTAETRHLRTQMNADHLVDDVELLEGRMHYLDRLEENLQLSNEFMAGKTPTAKESALQFFTYVVQSGKDPKDFLGHLATEGDNVHGWREWQREYQKLLKKCPAHLAAMMP